MGGISPVTARPITKFPPQSSVASINNTCGGNFIVRTPFLNISLIIAI